VRRLLGDAFLRTIGDLGAKGLAMSVHGMGRMNADFPSLPSNFRSSIMAAIARIAPNVNSQEVSNILYGLGKMGAMISVSAAKKVSGTGSGSGSGDGQGQEQHGQGQHGQGQGELACELSDDEFGEPEFVDSCHVPSCSSHKGFSGEVVAVGMTRKARESILEALAREAWQMTAQGTANSCWYDTV
jgi:hypothetical protein